MTAHQIAPRTERCGEKVAYRSEEAALLALLAHDRQGCQPCRDLKKVMGVYRCKAHFHCGHCALGYGDVDYRR